VSHPCRTVAGEHQFEEDVNTMDATDARQPHQLQAGPDGRTAAEVPTTVGAQAELLAELDEVLAQRERLTAQALLAAAGDPEAMQLDEDFLRALEYGLPPTGGMGMGVDRLLMTLTGLGIRETILYPLVRSE
jgi:aspartyl/asparaginyl-tRNA synthetase